LEKWIISGLFDSLGIEQTELLKKKESINNFMTLRSLINEKFKNHLPLISLKNRKDEIVKISTSVINEKEYDYYGFFVRYYLRWRLISNKIAIKSSFDIVKRINVNNKINFTINIYSIIKNIEKKNNSKMIVWLQDARSLFKISISMNLFLQNKEIMNIYNELLFRIVIVFNDGKVEEWKCDKIAPFDV